MKELNTYLTEKLSINKNTKINSHPIINIISDIYLSASKIYKDNIEEVNAIISGWIKKYNVKDNYRILSSDNFEHRFKEDKSVEYLSDEDFDEILCNHQIDVGTKNATRFYLNGKKDAEEYLDVDFNEECLTLSGWETFITDKAAYGQCILVEIQ